MSEELKREILNHKVDDEQLDQTTGGTAFVAREPTCTKISKRDDCKATVELDSWCSSNDACYIWDCSYDNCLTSIADKNK